MYEFYNPNPEGARVGDCAVRAVSKALNQSWIKTYIHLCLYGLISFDMPSSNYVWGKYLKKHGFKRHIVPDTCPDCYTVFDFLVDHPKGKYVIGVNGHVLTAVDGCIYDTWNSEREIPIFYWHKE